MQVIELIQVSQLLGQFEQIEEAPSSNFPSGQEQFYD